MATDSDIQAGQDLFGGGSTERGYGSETVRNEGRLLGAIMDPAGWTFLSEPAWKWAVFFVAVMCFLVAWRGALNYMK